MQLFRERQSRKRVSLLREIPLRLDYKHGSLTQSHFGDGSVFSLSCLGCLNPKCMFFSSNEIECDSISGFPYDQSLNSCPTDAMRWDFARDLPIIDEKKCILCGICIRRCPSGSLYFDGQVKVNTSSSEKQQEVVFNKYNFLAHTTQLKRLSKIKRYGEIAYESDNLLKILYRRILQCDSNTHNVVVRNLLISLNCKCSISRIGDIYTRMDAVFSTAKGSFGAVEVEFGRDTLDASRRILEDIAVLYTRYGVEKTSNKATVVCLQLPNTRQGYWQVVKDIMKVESIKISTISIGALILLVWNGRTFQPENDFYYLDFDNMDLRSRISKQLCRNIQLSEKHLGILEPLK